MRKKLKFETFKQQKKKAAINPVRRFLFSYLFSLRINIIWCYKSKHSKHVLFLKPHKIYVHYESSWKLLNKTNTI